MRTNQPGTVVRVVDVSSRDVTIAIDGRGPHDVSWAELRAASDQDDRQLADIYGQLLTVARSMAESRGLCGFRVKAGGFYASTTWFLTSAAAAAALPHLEGQWRARIRDDYDEDQQRIVAEIIGLDPDEVSAMEETAVAARRIGSQIEVYRREIDGSGH